MTRSEATKVVESLYDGWASLLVRHAVHLTGDPSLAEDMTQEAFLALYQKLRLGEEIGNPRAWTLAVVRNQARKRARNHQLHPYLLEPPEVLDLLADPATDAADWSAERSDIVSLLGVLTRRESEVLLLRIESRKYREIADQLGISAKSVATLLARALRKLQLAAQARIEGEYVLAGKRTHASKTL
jgi:RNA polymerase sigma factor (sigma-70 family)